MEAMEHRDWHSLLAAAAEHKSLALAAVIVVAAALRWQALSASAGAVETSRSYLPVMAGASCAPIPGEGYSVVTLDGSHPSLAAELHPDLNLAVRGYAPTSAESRLVDYGGSADARAPQLAGLLAGRSVCFDAAYQVLDWDWDAMCRGARILDPVVTALGFVVHHGVTVHVPASGYTIGDGWEVLVLYASHERITLKYTREDNVVLGYTLHVEHVCVEPRLLSLYETCEAQGRTCLPALAEGQAFGRARGDQVVVAIRDHGRFLDPRSRKDWWQGY